MKYGDAKVLVLDIETAPDIAAIWSCGYKLNVGPENLIKERFIISAQWKWAGEKEVHGKLSNIKKGCDKQLIKHITSLIGQADAVIGHNIKKFDSRWIEGRALLNGLPPVGLPFKTMFDTMALAKRAMSLNSYKLDYIAKSLGIPGKTKTSFSDWMEVLVDKDIKAATRLLEYGKNDVVINEKVFTKLLPYVKLPVNLSTLIYGDGFTCSCGSTSLHQWGRRVTAKGTKVYQRYRCNDCGSMTQIEKEERE